MLAGTSLHVLTDVPNRQVHGPGAFASTQDRHLGFVGRDDNWTHSRALAKESLQKLKLSLTLKARKGYLPAYATTNPH